MLKINTKKENKTEEENKKRSSIPRYIIFLILSIILGGIFTALTSYAATIAASNISYDNTTSGLSATNAQAGIDETFYLINKPKYGDYINYQPTSNEASLSKDKTGLDSDLTWSPSEITTWIVTNYDKDYIYAASYLMPSNPIHLYVGCPKRVLTSSDTDSTVLCVRSIKNFCDNVKYYNNSYGGDGITGATCRFITDNNFTVQNIFGEGAESMGRMHMYWEATGDKSLFGEGTVSTCGKSVDDKYYREVTSLSYDGKNILNMSFRCNTTMYYEYATGSQVLTSGRLNNWLVPEGYFRPNIKIIRSKITGGTGTKNNPWVV